jgi:hypothetical protein
LRPSFDSSLAVYDVNYTVNIALQRKLVKWQSNPS